MVLPTRSGKTFAAILATTRGVGPGFDLLRLALALLIMASHCSFLAGTSGLLSHLLHDVLHGVWPTGSLDASGPPTPPTAADLAYPPVTGPGRPFTLSHVPMFFALSGFLVSGSAFRTRRVLPFVGLRVIRIVPALFVEIFLSAVVLGGLFTTLPLDDYYTSSGFFSYFTNVAGVIKFTLPGVFTHDTPTDVVNSNLWTLPAELHSYLIAAVLIGTGVLFNRRIMTAIFVVATLALVVANTGFGYKDMAGTLDGDIAVYYFFAGVIFYLWKDVVPHSRALFIVALVFSYALMMSTRTAFIYPVLLTYVTLFIGLARLPQVPLLKTGDYSYGIYLYGYPISQALVVSVPALRGDMPALLASAVAVTLVFSVLSWHLVEKRFMPLKRLLSPRSAQIAVALHPDAGAASDLALAAIHPTANPS